MIKSPPRRPNGVRVKPKAMRESSSVGNVGGIAVISDRGQSLQRFAPTRRREGAMRVVKSGGSGVKSNGGTGPGLALIRLHFFRARQDSMTRVGCQA
jgi:hypothetical protein